MAKAINSWVFLDFETGGLDPRKHAVTEVAMVAIKGDTLEKIDLMSTFIKPYGDYQYDPEALKHTGITFSDIESGVSVEEAVSEMLVLLKKADLNPRNKGSKPLLVAYNSAFDKGFLLQLFDYTNKLGELEKVVFGKEDYYRNFQPEMVDGQFFTKAAYGADPDIANFKLGTCIEKAGIELPDAHKAINDTIALKDMFSTFFSKLRANGEVSTEAVTGKRFREHFQF
jgi:DNA polymerase-3 subunit alpha (Gram-positive type)